MDGNILVGTNILTWGAKMGFDWKSAVGGIVGDTIGAVLDQKEQNKNRQQQDQTNQMNYDMQKEFARMGIRWKVEDALAAGIHPLAAVGAVTNQASPSFQIDGGSDRSIMGDLARNLGQNVSRAFNSASTEDERKLRALQIEEAKIDLAMKKKALEGMDTPTIPNNFGPGGLSGQQMQGGPAHPAAPHQTQGYAPEVSFTRGSTTAMPYIPTNLSESFESDPIGGWTWGIKHRVAPNVNPWHGARPSSKDLPAGFDMWRWSTGAQAWLPVKFPSWYPKWMLKRVRAKQARENQYR